MFNSANIKVKVIHNKNKVKYKFCDYYFVC